MTWNIPLDSFMHDMPEAAYYGSMAVASLIFPPEESGIKGSFPCISISWYDWWYDDLSTLNDKMLKQPTWCIETSHGHLLIIPHMSHLGVHEVLSISLLTAEIILCGVALYVRAWDSGYDPWCLRTRYDSESDDCTAIRKIWVCKYRTFLLRAFVEKFSWAWL